MAKMKITKQYCLQASTGFGSVQSQIELTVFEIFLEYKRRCPINAMWNTSRTYPEFTVNY